ncbi:zinc ribbon domain-containing protein [Micromonospora sp. NPDC048830]|uniref:zinc ribbon domain-containing protein n=1 Tax=Micromonospora sp. NPDC048830 TaxID=3364257 RepID=UPI0037238B44
MRCAINRSSRYGRAFAKINRFVPTSQTCSACGWLDGPKPLSVRSWTCPCGGPRPGRPTRRQRARGESRNPVERR